MLAIAGGKGGTGTTTTAVGVAQLLTEPGYVVDADWLAPALTRLAGATPGWPDTRSWGTGTRSTGSATRAGGSTTRAGRSTVSGGTRADGQPTTDEESSAAEREAAFPGRISRRLPLDGDSGSIEPRSSLRLVPAPKPGQQGRTRLGRLLRACRYADRRTVVDCPSGVDGTVSDVLRTADRVVVTTRPTRVAVRGARETVRLARALGTPVAGFLVVHHGGPMPAATRVAPDDRLDPPVLAWVPAVEGRPLADDRVRDAHRELLATVEGGDTVERGDTVGGGDTVERGDTVGGGDTVEGGDTAEGDDAVDGATFERENPQHRS